MSDLCENENEVEPNPSPNEQLADEESQRHLALVRLDPEAWFRTHAKIKLRNGSEVIGCQDVTATQKPMFEHYRRCRQAGVPCKILVMKPRRDGASTGAQAIIYHHLQNHEGLTGKLMANTDDTSAEVSEIFSRMANGDVYDWGGDQPPVKKELKDAGEIILGSGSRMKLLSSRGEQPGRGGEAQVANLTECAHYPDTKDPTGSFLLSVQAALTDPVGLIIADSTPNGPRGWFYRMVTQVRKKMVEGTWTLDDWFLVFVPWWEGFTSRKAFKSQHERETFERSLRPDEIEEMDRYGTDHATGKQRITLEALNWRRMQIDQLLDGDVEKFRQEYPSDVLEAFLLNTRSRFSQKSLEQYEATARPGQVGNFTENEDGAAFVPDIAGLWEVWEQPRFDCSYLTVVDTMTGEDQTNGKDPDWHSVQVHRAAFIDEFGREWLPRVVARHSSRLEVGVLVKEVIAVSKAYGTPGETCIIIPEVNNSGLALVTLLKDAGVNLYERKTVNRTTSEEKRSLGWMTDPTTRKTIVDELAMVVLKRQMDIPSKEIVGQLRTFIVTKNGKPQAMEGAHDDDVLALAIGSHNLPLATKRTMPRRKLAQMTDGFRTTAELEMERAIRNGSWGDE